MYTDPKPSTNHSTEYGPATRRPASCPVDPRVKTHPYFVASRKSAVYGTLKFKKKRATTQDQPNEESITRSSSSGVVKTRVTKLPPNVPTTHRLKLKTNDVILINEFQKKLAALPTIQHIPQLDDMRTMKFAIARDSGLIEHLKMVIPQRDWQTEDVFLFPGCIHRCVTNTQHVLAFGPLDQNLSECTGSGLEYRIQSRFKHFHGMTRELFLNHQNGLVYAGRFKMHSLERLAPQGLYLPEDISPHHIAVAATPPLLPRGFPSFRQLGEMYKSGSLKVEAVALQMVDYDEGIYRTLLKPVQVKKGNQKLAPKALKEGTRVL